mmetsp:Transcript_4657/g.11292  ORF Transcript_4657/g.11292 Transcript_4657/m.11292 type:complete len:233 (-) Transcript_4657:461-1159(-)
MLARKTRATRPKCLGRSSRCGLLGRLLAWVDDVLIHPWGNSKCGTKSKGQQCTGNVRCSEDEAEHGGLVSIDVKVWPSSCSLIEKEHFVGQRNCPKEKLGQHIGNRPCGPVLLHIFHSEAPVSVWIPHVKFLLLRLCCLRCSYCRSRCSLLQCCHNICASQILGVDCSSTIRQRLPAIAKCIVKRHWSSCRHWSSLNFGHVLALLGNCLLGLSLAHVVALDPAGCRLLCGVG